MLKGVEATFSYLLLVGHWYLQHSGAALNAHLTLLHFTNMVLHGVHLKDVIASIFVLFLEQEIILLGFHGGGCIAIDKVDSTAWLQSVEGDGGEDSE